MNLLSATNISHTFEYELFKDVSLELDEILDLSDRIAVINSGELIDMITASETNENEVGLMMAGIKRESKNDNGGTTDEKKS